jgi:hypothetical protein
MGLNNATILKSLLPNCGSTMLTGLKTKGISARSSIGIWMQGVNDDKPSYGYAFVGYSNSSYYTGTLAYSPFIDDSNRFSMTRYKT